MTSIDLTAPPATITGTEADLIHDLQCALFDADTAHRLLNWRDMEKWRRQRDVDLAERLSAIRDRGIAPIRWGVRADGGWWFRAFERRSQSSVTLHLAVRKWINPTAAGSAPTRGGA